MISNASEPTVAAVGKDKAPVVSSGSDLIPARSREKLTNLMDLVATALGLDFERRQEFTGKLLQITAERLVRFDEACQALGHDDERIRTLALEEVAENLLDWVLVRVVLSLWDGRGNGARRGRPPAIGSAK